LRAIVPALRRVPLVHRLRDTLVNANSRAEARAPMDPELRRRLTAEMAPEVETLERLIGRDLGAWRRVA
jgi:hypothetical protein